MLLHRRLSCKYSKFVMDFGRVIIGLVGSVLAAEGCNNQILNPIAANLENQQPHNNGAKPIPLSECKCGVSIGTKIVGGSTAGRYEYPWQVGLIRRLGSSPYCGGSIISDREILTAAHCTRGRDVNDINVLVGEHNLAANDGDYTVRVCGKSEHPNYRQQDALYFDYAVLTLCSPLEFSTTVLPVCLPTTEGQETKYEDQKAIISGWGTMWSGGSLANTLQEVEVTTMSNAECCSSKYKYTCTEITDDMICAADPGKDSCQGDSGGPMIVKESSGYYTQVGVVSWGYGCAKADAPGVYARVSNQLSWIKSNMAGVMCPPSA